MRSDEVWWGLGHISVQWFNTFTLLLPPQSVLRDSLILTDMWSIHSVYCGFSLTSDLWPLVSKVPSLLLFLLPPGCSCFTATRYDWLLTPPSIFTAVFVFLLWELQPGGVYCAEVTLSSWPQEMVILPLRSTLRPPARPRGLKQTHLLFSLVMFSSCSNVSPPPPAEVLWSG